MSKRNIRDWMSRAFFAKDKASFARLADEAENEAITLAKGDPDEDTGHKEPDGDEGKHPQNVHIHVEHQGEGGGNGNGDSNGLVDRVTKLEDGVKSIDSKLGRLLDALPPEFLKNKKDGDEDTDDADGTRSKDADWGGNLMEGGDITGKGGGNEENGLTMKAPPSSSAELVEADPALTQEKTRMGDAAYKARTIGAMGTVMRDTLARAEVLSPGIKAGTLDAGGIDKWEDTQKRLHALRKSALQGLMKSDKAQAILGPYATTADQLSYDATRLIFNDASEKIRQANNAANVPSPMFGDTAGSIRHYRSRQEAIIGGINDANREYWAKQGVNMGQSRKRAA